MEVVADDEETEEMEEVTDHPEHSRNRLQNHCIRLSILCILRCGIKIATVSIHSRQFQSIAIGICIALLILVAMDRGEKGRSCGDIPLYILHALRRK